MKRCVLEMPLVYVHLMAIAIALQPAAAALIPARTVVTDSTSSGDHAVLAACKMVKSILVLCFFFHLVAVR